MNIANLSSKELRRAATLKEKIENLTSELAGLLGGNGGRSPKGTRSAATRVKMAAAQRARWARTPDQAPAKPRRKMSAAAKAKMATAAKARWAKAKAAGKNSL